MDTSDHLPRNNFKVEGNWSLLSKKLKQLFPMLTEEDLLLEHHKHDELLVRIVSRLEITPDEVITLLQKIHEEIKLKY